MEKVRLIDANVLKRELCIEMDKEKIGKMGLSDIGLGINDAIDCLMDAPTVEAEPVRHGRWIKHAEYAVCSECMDDCWSDSVLTYNYCPNCGAKMDLKVME